VVQVLVLEKEEEDNPVQCLLLISALWINPLQCLLQMNPLQVSLASHQPATVLMNLLQCWLQTNSLHCSLLIRSAAPASVQRSEVLASDPLSLQSAE